MHNYITITDAPKTDMQFLLRLKRKREVLEKEPGVEVSFQHWLLCRIDFAEFEVFHAYENLTEDEGNENVREKAKQASAPYAQLLSNYSMFEERRPEYEQKIIEMFMIFNDLELIEDSDEGEIVEGKIVDLESQDNIEEDYKEFKSELQVLPLIAPLKGGVRGRRFIKRGPPRGTPRRRGGVRRRIFGRSVINTPKQSIIEVGDTVRRVMKFHKDILRIPRIRYMAESVVLDFVFHDATLTKTNNGVAYVSWTYCMNDLEDVTPSGNNDIPGITAWSTFFSKYRVLRTSYSIDLGNMEESPVNIVAWPSTTDLGVNSSTTTQAFSAPLCTSALISGKGGMDRARLKGSIDLGLFSGNIDNYLSDDNYSGTLPSGNVTTGLWLNVGGVVSGTFTTNLGLDYRATLTMTTLLTGRKNLIA